MYMSIYILRNIALQLLSNECRQEIKVEQDIVAIRTLKNIKYAEFKLNDKIKLICMNLIK